MPDMQVRILAFFGDASGGISDEKNNIFFVPYLTLADIWHPHASLLINQGCDALILADRLGHEKVSTTLNTYSHLFPHKQQSLVESLESLGAAAQPAPEPPDGDLSLITLSEIDDILDTIPTPAMLPEKEKAPGKVILLPIPCVG